MEYTTADAAQTKKSLPLFGKKKTFGFDKLKTQAAPKQPATAAQSAASTGEGIEEFDDDDDGNEASVKISKNENSKIESVSNATTIKPNSIDEDNESKTDVATTQDCTSETNAKEIPPLAEKKTKQEKEECIDDEEKKESIHEHEKATSTENHISSSSPSVVSATNVQNNSSSSSGASSKQKSKNRHRNKMRHQIDIDDTEEDTSPQKYSGWMPPENQTGDGMTALNSKYGY